MTSSTPLTESQEEALVARCLFAAFADREKSDAERGEVRRLADGAISPVAGKTGGKVADQATESAFSFAATYALGLMADRDYSSGRSLTPDQMRTGFQSLLGQARTLHAKVLPQIQDRAKTLNAGSLIDLLRDPAAV